jgi:CDP-paratose 2-epimerase
MTQPIALITGSAGLVGSTAARFFAGKEFRVVGIDNDMRAELFGKDASTLPVREQLYLDIHGYTHCDIDIRDRQSLVEVFAAFGDSIRVIIHAAAQPSHDWAARSPLDDFGINAVGTLHMLECTRKYCPDAAFVFCSTNKVYGDAPNRLSLVEGETRYESDDLYFKDGIDESLDIDQSMHSLFGCSKLAADVLVQEYGRYFGMQTVCFRGGCLTGPAHAGAKLHGFLSYLVKCAVSGQTYQIIGHKGKQVRDNLHAEDLVAAFWEYCRSPRPGEVYNIGGGRERSCSVIEAIRLVERISGTRLKTDYTAKGRRGDHIWWITDTRKFERDYPAWKQKRTLEQTIEELVTKEGL